MVSSTHEVKYLFVAEPWRPQTPIPDIACGLLFTAEFTRDLHFNEMYTDGAFSCLAVDVVATSAARMKAFVCGIVITTQE
jgi:hypothetical protein